MTYPSLTSHHTYSRRATSSRENLHQRTQAKARVLSDPCPFCQMMRKALLYAMTSMVVSSAVILAFYYTFIGA